MPQLLAVGLMLSLVFAAGCASTRGATQARTPGNFIDDGAIETLGSPGSSQIGSRP